MDWGDGRWNAADERARHELVDRGCRRGMIGSLDVIGLVALGRGRADEARRWLDESLAAGRRIGEVQLHPDAALGPRRGRPRSPVTPGAAIARCEEGLDDRVDDGRAGLLDPVRRHGDPRLPRRPPAGRCRALALTGRGRTSPAGMPSPARRSPMPTASFASRRARSAAAREALELAIGGWTERGRIWEATWARLDLGAVPDALEPVRGGCLVAGDGAFRGGAVGSAPLIARADELARIGRGRGTVEEPWRPLTAREWEVARLIAEGMTNAEIAA